MDYRAGMFVYASAFLLGDMFVQQLSVLPDLFTISVLSFNVCLLAAALLVSARFYNERFYHRYLTLTILYILLFFIGIIYTSLFANHKLETRLDESLVGQSLLVSGVVSNIPAVNGHVQRFIFDVEDLQILTSNRQHSLDYDSGSSFPNRLRLNWYYGKVVNTSQRWQFEVRLKPPHGFMNPASFDYESWLFQQGIDATGYVRKSDHNKQLNNLSIESLAGSANRLREKISQFINVISHNRIDNEQSINSDYNSFALIKALAIGEKSSISSKQWQVLTSTGTSHLMAISGLHVGLAALFAYVLTRRLVPSSIAKRVPIQHVSLIVGLIVALLYALIAGLSIPTQRAIIMLSVLSMMLLIRHNHRPVDALGFALMAILMVDPLAVLSVGFWFSFAAVAVIFLSISSRSTQSQMTDKPVFYKIIGILKQWVRLQVTINIFLLPLSLFMFQQVSLISPVANFLLIPYVSFLVVPVVLLALVFTFLSPIIAEYLYVLAANMIDFIWPALHYLSSLPYALWINGEVDFLVLISATLMISILFFIIDGYLFDVIKKCSKRNKKIIILIVCIASTFFTLSLFVTDKSGLIPGEYEITILDVGQGSAAVLQTKNHVMVIDAGAKFSDKLDAGSSVIVPYLRSQGINSLDYLMVSHGDNDHIGGAQAIIDAYLTVTILGQDIESLKTETKQDCHDGLNWQWDGVDFEILSPEINNNRSLKEVKRNNRSCVLRVSSEFGSVLFPGDAERKVEKRLLELNEKQLASDVLIVPHHGSNTSSSSSFVDAVNPAIAIFSVGYKNRYKLPNKKVLNRYLLKNIKLVETAKSGAITIQFAEASELDIIKHRDNTAKYWNHILN
jgi:competence protein ComEC